MSLLFGLSPSPALANNSIYRPHAAHCHGNPDNPTPVAAAAPPTPKPEELNVPKKRGGQVYGANAQYQKAMERLNKGGS